MINELKTGYVSSTDGNKQPARGGRTGETSVADAHGRYVETAYRGNVYFAATQNSAFTSSVGITTTTIVGLVIRNAVGSGKNVALLQAEFIPSGVVAGAMAISLLPFQQTDYTHTTTLTVRSALGAPTGSNSVVLADQGATTTITPVPAKIIFSCLSTNTAQPACSALIDIGGSLLVPPGCGAAILGTAALTGWASLLWEEIPV